MEPTGASHLQNAKTLSWTASTDILSIKVMNRVWVRGKPWWSPNLTRWDLDRLQGNADQTLTPLYRGLIVLIEESVPTKFHYPPPPHPLHPREISNMVTLIYFDLYFSVFIEFTLSTSSASSHILLNSFVSMTIIREHPLSKCQRMNLNL